MAKIPSVINGPTPNAVDIIPDDSEEFQPTRGIYIGGSGNLKVLLANSESPVTFSNVVQGSILPIMVIKVYTDTTATNLIALY